jgi:alkane 1-monooxygenase
MTTGRGAGGEPAKRGGGWIATRAANTVRYSLMNIFVLIGIATIAHGGWWTWTGLFLSFFLIGYVDELVGDAGDREDMPPVWYLQGMLYLTLPLLVLVTLAAFNTTSEAGFAWLDALFGALGFGGPEARARTDFWGDSGAFVSVGMFYGVAGVNVAHELIHRLDKPFDMLVGRWLLAFTWDTGFAIEHVHGHHRTVGTEADPATARRGDYIFAFVVRSTIGQWVSALRFEQDRLKRKGIPDTPWTNRFWRGQLMTLCVVAFYCAFLGIPDGLVTSAFTGAIGKIYLEVVNYIEHYGLVRMPGTPVQPRHSWDSYRRVSSGAFYNLQLHAHHHAVATRRFWELHQQNGQAPVLPYGYMASIFIAFVPSLWKKVSDPLLADWDRRLASDAERGYLADKGLLLGAERAAPAVAAEP